MIERPSCTECIKPIWGIAKVFHTVGTELPIHLHAVCYEKLIGKVSFRTTVHPLEWWKGYIVALKRSRVELAELHRGNPQVNSQLVDKMLVRLINE